MCRPRLGEANPLFSVCSALWRSTTTASRKKPSHGRGISDYKNVYWVDDTLIYTNNGKQRICLSKSWSAHFHVSWLSDFIFYQKPLCKSLHQSFFNSFITILPSERGVAKQKKAVGWQRNLGLIKAMRFAIILVLIWSIKYIFDIPIPFCHNLYLHNHLTLRKGCYTPLQHDFALDPIIPPFDFHFEIYIRDLAILTEWWQQRIVWWKQKGGENACSFRSPWVILPLNLFFPTHFALFPSPLIWAVDGTVCPAKVALHSITARFSLSPYHFAIWLSLSSLQTWSCDTNWMMTTTHCMMGAT
jgi:hypothetical protein